MTSPTRTRKDQALEVDVRAQRFSDVMRAEWIKFWTVRSTVWSLVTLVVLGVGATATVCAASAEGLASGEANEVPASFVTFGMTLAQVSAVVLGGTIVTAEHTTGMVRSTFVAVPRRARVLAAKMIVLTSTLLVLGTVTATLGYLAGNWFLAAEGVGVPLDSDGVVRALYGNGLYLAGLGLMTMAVGLLVRHTAATLATVLALVFVLNNMSLMLPGAWGEWVSKLLPSNAASSMIVPVNFNPEALDAWPGFGVFLAQTTALLVIALLVVRHRDA